jgi:hypothetical protein
MIELDQVNTWTVQILKILENRASFIKDEREREEQSVNVNKNLGQLPE